MEQIHHDRRAQLGIFQQRGHVKAHHAGREVELVGGIVEQPAMLAILDPRRQAIRQITRLRAAISGYQLLKMTQAAQRAVIGIGGIDRCGDRCVFFRPIGFEQHGEPIAQEAAIGGSVRQSKWVEAGRLARPDAVVVPADATNEQFCTAVLVEQDRAGAEFLRLRGKKIHHHGLARTAWSDDREIAQIAMVEIEEERC